MFFVVLTYYCPRGWGSEWVSVLDACQPSHGRLLASSKKRKIDDLHRPDRSWNGRLSKEIYNLDKIFKMQKKIHATLL